MAPAMESPYTVTSLSRPLDAEHGRIQAAPIYSFRGLKKRKRHEVVVGVDGESLNIYNLQAQSLIASYAIPPQTYLCCAPCSVYVKRTAARPAQRYTYAALSEGRGSVNYRLVRFVENLGGNASFAAPVKSEVKLRGSPFALEVLPSSAETSQQAPAVLASYTDGDVECMETDHGRVQWAYNSDKKSQVEVEISTAVDSETARKGILKGRNDVLAALSTSTTGDSLQLYRVVRRSKELSLQIFRLRVSALQQAGGTFSGMDLLDSVVLSSDLTNKESVTCEVNAGSGLVYRLASGKITVWNLTDSIPRLQTIISDGADSITSFVRTSPAHVLAATSQASTLYDAKFGSVQGTSMRRPALDAVTGKKRKRQPETGNDVQYQLVSSFSDLGLAVAVDGHELVAFRVTSEAGGAKRSRASEPLLIDAIGKSQSSRQTKARSSKSDEQWQEWTSKIDELVKQDDVYALEEFVNQDLGLECHSPEKGSTTNGINGDARHPEALWRLETDAYDPATLDKPKAVYLLASLFSHQRVHLSSTIENLELRIRARNLLHWLAMSGVLDSQQLSSALNATVEPGSITKAIGRADDTFQLLQDLLGLPTFLASSEVTSALALLIDSLDTRSTESALLALPSSSTQNANNDMSTLEDAASTFEYESRAAEKELTHAISALQTGLNIRSHCLRLIFARLRALPPNEVRTAFRQHLSQRNLVFFIQMLRVELAEGGWTSRYIDVGNDEYANRTEASEERQTDSRGPSDQALRHIGQLLTCAIDAIGMNGWLVGLAGDVETTQDILDSIRAEVSASLEGCLEAQTLERFLSELESFADDVERSGATSRVRKAGKMGASELPLGCRYETGGKKGKGQKTVLEIARERDARVGKYSVDRIRV